MMSRNRVFLVALASIPSLLGAWASQAQAQIVINEFVKEERSAGSGGVTDAREFVELYNAGATPVPIGGWSISTYRLTGNNTTGTVGAAGAYYGTDVITPGTVLNPGQYYVMGAAGVPNVNQVISFNEIYQDGVGTVLELRSGGATTDPLVDAVGYDMFRVTAANTNLPDRVQPTVEQAAQLGGGYWGQLFSVNVDTSLGNVPTSLGRWRNGKDSNRNGLDFGHLPMTPGASNLLPSAPAYIVPNVDAMTPDTVVGGYNASFVLPRVVNPTVATSVNPKAIPASPQGGNAIVAWDETGGGNAVYTTTLVNKFDLYAYLDPTPYVVAGNESTVYGIGTTDPFYATPDPGNDLLVAATVPQNSNTGIGWLFQKDSTPHTAKLMLVDFNDGGDSKPAIGDWTVLETIDLGAAAAPAGWHRLGVDYNPATGAVTAFYDGQTFNHTVSANRDGTFYVGYREGLPDAGGVNARPATYDLYVPPAEDADFNNDNIVNGNDFLIWQRGFGGAGTNATGDADGNGQVNAADLAIWKAKFGTPGATPATAAIPEPATAMLALAGLASCVAGTRSRRA